MLGLGGAKGATGCAPPRSTGRVGLTAGACLAMAHRNETLARAGPANASTIAAKRNKLIFRVP